MTKSNLDRLCKNADIIARAVRALERVRGTDLEWILSPLRYDLTLLQLAAVSCRREPVTTSLPARSRGRQ